MKDYRILAPFVKQITKLSKEARKKYTDKQRVLRVSLTKLRKLSRVVSTAPLLVIDAGNPIIIAPG